jgi:transcriptional regulator with XRE-family HTH domain
MPRTIPTVRARRLGRELRLLREHHDLSTDAAAARLGWSQSKVSRIETAYTVPSPTDVGHVLDLYGVDSPTRAALLQLAHEAKRRGWWQAFGDVYTGSYFGMEDEAKIVRTVETTLIPGLFQTAPYARAVIEASYPDDPDRVNRSVRARMTRKELLSRPDAPQVIALINEGALHEKVGGPEVMREQLSALHAASQGRNVTVRVLPFSAGANGGLDGPFSILSFGEDFPDVAWTGTFLGELYEESADQLRRVRLAFERMYDAALPVEESLALIANLVEE